MRGKLDDCGHGVRQARLIPARAAKTSWRRRRRPAPRAHPRVCGENRRVNVRARLCGGSSPRVRGKRDCVRRPAPSRGLIPARAGKTPGSSRARSGRGAHPRACGENNGMGEGVVGCFGSSPRVRGKPIEQQFLRARVGLIPARAGKTPSTTSPKKARPAHPRACGENIKTTAPPAIEAGSSPRVRGKLPTLFPQGPRRGLIPARAGKTTGAPGRPASCPAHPRACGENLNPARFGKVLAGSSPRVRGKLGTHQTWGSSDGLIPARAGKTSARSGTRATRRAHPRACGENKLHAEVANILLGSSPRVRGKPRLLDPADRPPGIIPARAGKTPPAYRACPRPPDHPRACGENKRVNAIQSCSTGSSPRVRGKQLAEYHHDLAVRIIPARAGKTRTIGARRGVVGDHPRACGENMEAVRRHHPPAGSSPRVRGKREIGSADLALGRIIPARAGKTDEVNEVNVVIRDHPRACGENLRLG